MSEEEKINQPTDNSSPSPENKPVSNEPNVVNENPESEINKSEIKNMEVHKHPHHITHKKKWSEYLLEFLMLFLAVFLGFLAENFREHQVEKERGKQYIESFYVDLKTDTTEFSRLIVFDEKKKVGLNGMFSCYDTIQKNWMTNSCLAILVKYSSFSNAANFSDGTLQQLKNAGGFRLLNKTDRDSIISYDNKIKSYKDYESTLFQQSQDNVRNTFSMLGNFMANKFLNKSAAGADSSQTEMPLMFSNDKALLNKYFNDLFRYRVSIIGQIRQVKEIKEKATRLIEYFKKEYYFE